MHFGLVDLYVLFGQFILDICRFRGLDTEASGTITSIILIFISAFLTSLNLFNKIGKFAGARFFGSYYRVRKFHCFSCN